ncbi:hypothetical protein EJB05_44378, partial [Eragrostis curvula]
MAGELRRGGAVRQGSSGMGTRLEGKEMGGGAAGRAAARTSLNPARVILSHYCRMVAVGAICLPLMYSGSPSAPNEGEKTKA